MSELEKLLAAFAPDALDASLRAVYLIGVVQLAIAVVCTAVAVWLFVAFKWELAKEYPNDDRFLPLLAGAIFSAVVAVVCALGGSPWLAVIDPAAALAARFL